MSEYRPELPSDMPDAIAELPVHRGYPVPWFVAWLADFEGDKIASFRGEGEPDFRVIYPGAVDSCYRLNLCWICGGSMKLGGTATFVIGPMCAVNRVSAEPPSHEECATWAAKACPFLARPHMVRREAGLPEDATSPAGIMLERNPGVTLLWTSYDYRPRPSDTTSPGMLFNVGNPIRVRWLREGRDATRQEAMDSIESGLPVLVPLAAAQGATKELTRLLAFALTLLPPEPHAGVNAPDVQPAG